MAGGAGLRKPDQPRQVRYVARALREFAEHLESRGVGESGHEGLDLCASSFHCIGMHTTPER